ncbi:MAG: guanylate kinase [Firmicutes bacterium]|nr:guanylate kinase [Bacillota bacterium]
MRDLRRKPPTGLLIVLSGPSGVGKNTVLNQVLRQIPGLSYSISATTRKPRPGEVDGVHYFFCDQEHFADLIKQGRLLEWAEFCGNKYGTPRDFVEEKLSSGNDVILDVDIQGAAQIAKSMPQAVKIFLLPPSLEALRERIIARGAETEQEIERRLCAARQEIQRIVDYDYVVCNDNVDEAVRQIAAIITAEKSRVFRWLSSNDPANFFEGSEG